MWATYGMCLRWATTKLFQGEDIPRASPFEHKLPRLLPLPSTRAYYLFVETVVESRDDVSTHEEDGEEKSCCVCRLRLSWYGAKPQDHVNVSYNYKYYYNYYHFKIRWHVTTRNIPIIALQKRHPDGHFYVPILTEREMVLPTNSTNGLAHMPC